MSSESVQKRWKEESQPKGCQEYYSSPRALQSTQNELACSKPLIQTALGTCIQNQTSMFTTCMSHTGRIYIELLLPLVQYPHNKTTVQYLSGLQ